MRTLLLFFLAIVVRSAGAERFDPIPGEVYKPIGSTARSQITQQAVQYQIQWALHNNLMFDDRDEVARREGTRFGTTTYDWWATEIEMDMGAQTDSLSKEDKYFDSGIYPGMDNFVHSFPPAAAGRCDKFECVEACKLYQDRDHACRDMCHSSTNSSYLEHLALWKQIHLGPEPTKCDVCVTLTKDCVEKHCGLECEAITYASGRWNGETFPTCASPKEAKVYNNRKEAHDTRPMICVGDKVFNIVSRNWGTVKYVSIMRNLYKVQEPSRCWRCGKGILQFAQAEELIHHTSILRNFPKTPEVNLYPRVLPDSDFDAAGERPPTPYELQLRAADRIRIQARGDIYNAHSKWKIAANKGRVLYFKPESGQAGQSLEMPKEGVSEWSNEPDSDFDEVWERLFKDFHRDL